MELIARHLGDVLELAAPRFEDDRGSFTVAFNVDAARALGLHDSFVQDNHSISGPKGTVRGLHLQVAPHQQGKLVRVTQGSILDISVDLRPQSPTFAQHVAIELSASNNRQVFVPRGFAHGLCTLEPDTHVLYKIDGPWSPEAERSIQWDDPELGIDWPVDRADATLSDKDATGPPLADFLAELERT